MSPEDTADAVEDIVGILFEDNVQGRMLTREQWTSLYDTLDDMTHTITYATVLCLSRETRQFLEGMTDGDPTVKGLHDLLQQTLA